MSTQPPPPTTGPAIPDPSGRRGYNSAAPGSGASFNHTSSHSNTHSNTHGHQGQTGADAPSSGATPAKPHVLQPQPDGRRGYNADGPSTSTSTTTTTPAVLPSPDGRRGYNSGAPTHGGHSQEPHKPVEDPTHHAKSAHHSH